MSQMRFCYDDVLTDSTVVTYNSEETLLPVDNIWNEILSKKYRSKTGFIIKTGYNDIFQFYEGRTGSSTVVDFALSATTFTGSGLASAIQTAMRAGGMFSAQTVSYDSSTERFTTMKSATATAMSLRFDNVDMSVCEIMGYDKKDYGSASSFLSDETKGNQQWIELRKANLSGDVFVLHEHNFTSGTVLKLRAQSTSTYFYGLNQYGHGDGVFQAYTNLVQDPCDLRATGANWTASGATDELSTHSINGNLFTKIINSGANSGFNYQDFTPFTNTVLTGRVTLKKGNSSGNTAKVYIQNTTTSDVLFRIIIDWDNFGSSPGTPDFGTLLDYNWIDEETLELYFKCVAVALVTNTVRFMCYGSNNATDGEYTYWSEVQLIDEAEITMFPFVTGTHAADVIDETFTMPDKFIIDMEIDPKFAFDTSVEKRYTVWYIDNSHYLLLEYTPSSDKLSLYWKDGTIERNILAQQFDDGSSFTTINQRIRITILLNLIAGTQTNSSRIITIPLESGSIDSNRSWNGTPDIKSSTFSTLSVGNLSGGNQADSDIGYLRIYDWDGVDIGTITSSDDVDTALASKTRLLNRDYKHTDYMRFTGTSTTMGQFEQEITVNEDPCVTILDETLQGNVIQMSWTDIEHEYSEIGRAFLSSVFYPANHPDNKISWFKRLIQRRSGKTMAYSGATYFDKRDPVNHYTLKPDPLNEYYNPTTKTDMETFLDAVADYECFYVILDSDTSNTVYGFLPGNTEYNRQKNTPTIIIPTLVLQEQK